MFSHLSSPPLPAPGDAPHDCARDPAHDRRAAVAVCLLPLLGITAATAALLLQSASPGVLGWGVGATCLAAHAWLLRSVARRANDPR